MGIENTSSNTEFRNVEIVKIKILGKFQNLLLEICQIKKNINQILSIFMIIRYCYTHLLDLLGKSVDNPLVKNYIKRFPHHNIEASDRGTVNLFSLEGGDTL